MVGSTAPSRAISVHVKQARQMDPFPASEAGAVSLADQRRNGVADLQRDVGWNTRLRPMLS